MEQNPLSPSDVVWALGSICALHRRPFDPELLLKQLAPPYDEASLVTAARALGFKAKARSAKVSELASLTLPVLAMIHVAAADVPADASVDETAGAAPDAAA